jgi:hypothetical protein
MTDVQKQYSTIYPTGKKAMQPHLVDVPGDFFVMGDGAGDPNTSARFEEVTGALYSVSYTVKFAAKAAGNEYKVFPLEGLWWADDIEAFTGARRDEWKWRLMIRQPFVVGEDLIHEAIEKVVAKGKLSREIANGLRVERFEEGLCAQVLHIGPYEAEAPVIERLHGYIDTEGYALRDEHHEIYLGDPRRAAPEKLKTLLRQPVQPKSR